MEEQKEFVPFTKPQGRPKLAHTDKRSERVTIKYSPTELEKVTELSAKYAKPLRTYIRDLSIKDTQFNDKSKALMPEINRKTLMELNRIGVNMNQIIKAINQGRTIFQKEIEVFLQVLQYQESHNQHTGYQYPLKSNVYILSLSYVFIFYILLIFPILFSPIAQMYHHFYYHY